MSKVLIIENDQVFAKNLSEHLSSFAETIDIQIAFSGFHARGLIKVDFFDWIVVECFLSDINGVSLAQEMLEFQGEECKVIFTSNRSVSDDFIFQSLKNTKASRFYLKPVEPSKIAGFIFSELDKTPKMRSPFVEFATTSNPPRFEWLERMKKNGTLLGYELPMAIAQMMKVGEYNTLELFQNNQQVLALKFNRGLLAHIETPMMAQRDFLPVLLGDLQLEIDIEELRKNTSIQTVESERDLTQLLRLNRIAKHHYDQVIQLEALNRLSRFVRAEEFTLQLSKSPLFEANCWLGAGELLMWLGETVFRELPAEWTKSQIFFGDHLKVFWKDHFHYRDDIRQHLYLYGGDKIFKLIADDKVLSNIRSSLAYDEALILKGFYYMAAIGAIWFDEAKEEQLLGVTSADPNFHVLDPLKPNDFMYLSEEKQNLTRRLVIDLLLANCFVKAKEMFYQNLSCFVHHPLGILAKNWISLTTVEKILPPQLKAIEDELESIRLELKYEPAYYYAKAILSVKKNLPGESRKWIQLSMGLARCSKLLMGSKFMRADDLFKQTDRVIKTQGKSNNSMSDSLRAKISRLFSSSIATPSP